jgi:hypothetical protein
MNVLNALLVDSIGKFDNGRIDLIDIGLHRDLMFDTFPVVWDGMVLFFELELTPDVRGKRIHVYITVVAPDSSVVGEPEQFPVHLPTVEQYDGDSLPFDYNIPAITLAAPGKYSIRIHTSTDILRDVSFQVHKR